MAKFYADYSAYEKFRDKKGLTDYAVSQATGVATATLTSWKNNWNGKESGYEPKVDKMFAIAKVLEVPLEALYSEEEG